MSKFFATGESESESEDQQSSGDEGGGLDNNNNTTTATSKSESVGGGGGNKFVYSSSESEDEGKRVVRSEKDKRFDELQSTIKQLKNHTKIHDWTAIQKDFDQLLKQL